VSLCVSFYCMFDVCVGGGGGPGGVNPQMMSPLIFHYTLCFLWLLIRFGWHGAAHFYMNIFLVVRTIYIFFCQKCFKT
jgi:hypothetical protein